MDFTKVTLDKEYMTISEISKKFRISRAGILKIVKRQRIKMVWDDSKIGRWLISTKEFNNYIEQFN